MTDHLAAPALSLAIFFFWGILGYGLLGLLRSQRNVGQNLLLAPAVGVCVVLLPTFWLSWFGLPVARFGLALTAALAVAGPAALWWRRPVFPTRRFFRFAPPLCAAWVLTGWPLARNGFSWLSYANDDMINYCLLAERLLHHGLVEAPAAGELARVSDLSLYSWFLEIAVARAGSELLLAWTASMIPKSLPELFMPVIMALHLVLVSWAGALVYQRSWRRGAAATVCWLMALSALTTLGTLSQLIAQVAGIALGGSLVVVAWDLPRELRPAVFAARALLLGIVGSAFLLTYPEFAPFVGFALACRLGFIASQSPAVLVSQIAMYSTAGIVGLFLLAPYATRLLPFFLLQLKSGAGDSATEIFPYFLIPSGLGNLWGFLPIGGGSADPWLSTAIILGGVLLLVTFALTLRLLRRGDAAPSVLLSMFLLGLFLFHRESGFGLFKLAMFAQPFLLGTLVLSSTGYRRGRRGGRTVFILACVALPAVSTQLFYVRASLDARLGRAEVRHQTETLNELRRLGTLRAATIEVDSPSIVLTKLQGFYTRGVSQRLISQGAIFLPPVTVDMAQLTSPATARQISAAVVEFTKRRRFDLQNPADPSDANDFVLIEEPGAAGHGPGSRPPCDTVLMTTDAQSVLNRTVAEDHPERTMIAVPCTAIRDHLVFVASRLGRHYYLPQGHPVAIFGMEPDFFFPGRTLSGVGRHLLFEVINPSPSVRFVIDLTSSLKSDGKNLLPPAQSIGQARLPFDVIGRGSARLYSPPLGPQMIDGHAYIALDLGVDGSYYPDRRAGLMTLFGRDVLLDARPIVALARNISLVSEPDYAALVAPPRLAKFPDDLSNPALQYSGLYEDGWIGEKAWVRLTRPAEPGELVLRGTSAPNPAAGAPFELEVLVDGRRAAIVSQPPGPFEVRATLGAADSRIVTVALRFSTASQLPGADQRPVAARVDFLGFESGQPAH